MISTPRVRRRRDLDDHHLLLVLFFSLLSERWRFQRRDPSSKNTLGNLVTDPGRLVQRVAAKTRVENSRASGVRPLASSSGCFTQAYELVRVPRKV